MKFEIYTKTTWLGRREWRWRLRARNGEIVASGEGYTSKRRCVEAVELIQREAPLARVVEL